MSKTFVAPREFEDKDIIRSTRNIDPKTVMQGIKLTSDANGLGLDAHYEPRYDGINAAEAVLGHGTEYDGDDFTDRLDISADKLAETNIQDVATAVHRAMNLINTLFPGDMPVARANDEQVYAPWTTLRMKMLLGWCDAVAKILHNEYPDGRGGTRVVGLYAQRDKAVEKARRLYGTRNEARLEFQYAYIQQLDEQIATVEEIMNAVTDVYDKAAEKADMKGLLADFLPPGYKSPIDRRKDTMQRNNAPMTGVEYELMVRIEGREAADAEVARRAAAWK